MASHQPPSYIKTQPESTVSFDYIPQKHLKSSFLVINITDKLIMYKIKTNAPLSYVVKPHFGILQPSQVVDISIVMQPTNITPQTASLSDKFQVNAFPCPEGVDSSTLSDSNVFQKVWDSIHHKLRQASNLKVVLKFGLNLASDANEDITQASPKKSPLKTSDDKLQPNIDMENSQRSQNESIDIFQSMGKAPSSKMPRYETKPSIEEQSDNQENEIDSNLKEKISLLEKSVNELTTDIEKLNIMNQGLINKASQQEKLLNDLMEEKKGVQSELEQIKGSAFRERPANSNTSIDFSQSFQLWHFALAMVIGLILGGIFTP